MNDFPPPDIPSSSQTSQKARPTKPHFQPLRQPKEPSSQKNQNGKPNRFNSASPPTLTPNQTALFNFQSLLLVILLTICTSTYAHYVFPGIMDRNKDNYVMGIFWKCARVGERLSPYVSLACLAMAVRIQTSLEDRGGRGFVWRKK